MRIHFAVNLCAPKMKWGCALHTHLQTFYQTVITKRQKSVGQGHAGCDLLVDLSKDRPEMGISLLVLEEFEGLSEGQTSSKQGAELGIEEQEVLRGDTFTARHERQSNLRSRCGKTKDVESLAL